MIGVKAGYAERPTSGLAGRGKETDIREGVPRLPLTRDVTKEFANSLQVGRRKLIPSVSNLNRLWKLISPLAIRREKEDFLVDLPPKHVRVHWSEPSGPHALIVSDVEAAVADVLRVELNKPQEKQNMGRISMALWWGRYAASCPTIHGCVHYAGAFGHPLNAGHATPEEVRAIQDLMRLEARVLNRLDALSFNKLAKALEIIREAQGRGDKVIVFTSLRGLYRQVSEALDYHRIPWTGMDGVATRRRNQVVRQFESSDDVVLLAGTGTLNRGVTINGANHVVILNTEWSPEVTLQAEDRCHRPGQTKEVFVHYVLSSNTTDEAMWHLISQKLAAQRAVQSREAQFRSVEEILSEAALANAKLAVARDILARRIAASQRPAEGPETPKAEAEGVMWEELRARVIEEYGSTVLRAAQRRPRQETQQAAGQSSFFDLLAPAA